MLVAREAFGARAALQWGRRSGIDGLAARDVRAAFIAGRAVKLVARARRTEEGALLELAPVELDLRHPLARTRRESNALALQLEDGTTLTLSGKGAGRRPTAQSVMGDVLELARSSERSLRTANAEAC